MIVVHAMNLHSTFSAAFLQSGRIACNAERCNSYGNSVRLSVCLSHSGIVTRRMKIGSCDLCEVADG